MEEEDRTLRECEEELTGAFQDRAALERDLRAAQVAVKQESERVQAKEKEVADMLQRLRQFSDELTTLKADIRAPEEQKTRTMFTLRRELADARSEIDHLTTQARLLEFPSKYKERCKYDPVGVRDRKSVG